MTASVRGLVALAVVAIALAAAVLVHRGPAPVDRAIFPGFTGDAHELRWQRTVGEMHVTHEGDHWRMGTRTLDPRAIDAVLSALRGARWHRREDRARAGAVHTTLFVDGRPVSIGNSIAGADQTWLVVDNHALLVDGWVARALEPAPVAMVDREPFARAGSAPALRVGDLALTGTPLRSSLGVVAPARVAALTSALSAVEIVRLPAGSAAGTAVQIGLAAPIVVGGACAKDAPDLVALHAESGDGCVAPAAWQAVLAAAAAIATPDALDPRPAAFPLASIALPDGTIEFTASGIAASHVALGGSAAGGSNAGGSNASGSNTSGASASGSNASGSNTSGASASGSNTSRSNAAGANAAVDPDRVAELVAALAAPGDLVAPPAGSPLRTLTIAPRGGAPIALDVYADAVVRRGEPRAIRIARDALAVLSRPARAFADTTRWSEDPSVVSRLVVDGATFDRGATLGEWTGPHRDPALLDALAAAAANVRAPDAPLPAGFRAAHRISVTLAPPVGAKVSHDVELGAPTPAGCAARIDGAPVTAPPALCLAAAAAAR